jgi:Fic family protein
MVRISGSRVIMPNSVKVPILMKEFFEWLKSSDIKDPMTAIEAHYKFVSIHPFTDGNGRCARLLMNMLLLKSGYCPLIIRPIDRKRYINAIEKRQLTDVQDSYIKFMQTALERSLKVIINFLGTSKDIQDSKKLLTISKFAKLVGVPTSTIRYWVQIEKLVPLQYTDSGYMLFSEEQKEAAGKLKH